MMMKNRLLSVWLDLGGVEDPVLQGDHLVQHEGASQLANDDPVPDEDFGGEMVFSGLLGRLHVMKDLFPQGLEHDRYRHDVDDPLFDRST